MKAQVNDFRDRLSGKATPDKVSKIPVTIDLVMKVFTPNPTFGVVYYKHTKVPKELAIKIEAMITEHYEKEVIVDKPVKVNSKKVTKAKKTVTDGEITLELKEEPVLDNKKS